MMKTRYVSFIGMISMGLLFIGVNPVQAGSTDQAETVLEIGGDPLRILVDSDGTIQVFHSDYPDTGSVFGDTINGASGPFIAVGGDVFG